MSWVKRAQKKHISLNIMSNYNIKWKKDQKIHFAYGKPISLTAYIDCVIFIVIANGMKPEFICSLNIYIIKELDIILYLQYCIYLMYYLL